MHAGQRILALVCLGLGVAAYQLRQSVQHRPRSSPTGEGFAISNLPGVGQWAQIRERVGITENGLPMSRVLLVMPHNDTMPGLYSHHPSAPPLHKHLYQDEVFTVEQGVLGYVLNGVESLHTAPQGPLTLPLGMFHSFWNADLSQDLRMELQQITRKRKGKKVTRFAAYLETLFGLSRDYGGPANIPQLQKHLLFQEGGHLVLDAHKRIQLFIPSILCPLARLFGYRSSYPEYRSKSVQHKLVSSNTLSS